MKSTYMALGILKIDFLEIFPKAAIVPSINPKKTEQVVTSTVITAPCKRLGNTAIEWWIQEVKRDKYSTSTVLLILQKYPME